MQRLLPALLILLIASCDSTSPVDRPVAAEQGHSLSTFPSFKLQNDQFSVRVSGWGYITNLALNKGANRQQGIVGISPIWLAANQNGAKAVMPMFSEFPLAKQEYDNDSTGFFVLSADSLDRVIANWPTNLGAPSMADGTPLMMGDRMVWGAFRQSTSNQFPIEGLRLGMSVFLYDEGLESRYAFHRYDIVNDGDAVIDELYIGYGTDTDLGYTFDDFNPECKDLDYWKNQSGFDRLRRFNYFYFSKHDEDGDLPDHCYGLLHGFAVLPLTDHARLGDNLLASRIWRRNAPNTIYPDYSENLLTTHESILWALQGKSYTGEPMINPITGQTTLFAFDGDPTDRTGWIDERNDVRSMVSFQPVSLQPGEKISFVVAHFWAEAPSLEDGLSELQDKHAFVVYNPRLWDFQ